MSNSMTTYRGQLPLHSYEDWYALALKSLRGKAFETLIRRSEDNIPLGPLFLKHANISSRKSTKQDGRPWHVGVYIDHPDPAKANKDILAELQGGASHILVAHDPSGSAGVALQNKSDTSRLLADVHMDLASVSFLPGTDIRSAALLAAPFTGTKSTFSLGYGPLTLNKTEINHLRDPSRLVP